ncbi:hypothetical protein BC332_14902 [Capsicum chinense]|nr:hypothetical protein BC332_14902 [Capsicum chinense]
MGDDAPTPVDINQPSSPKKAWHSYVSEDLPRSVQQSTDSAIRSARSIQDTSSTHLRTLQQTDQIEDEGLIWRLRKDLKHLCSGSLKE